jgi:hypothetical protein
MRAWCVLSLLVLAVAGCGESSPKPAVHAVVPASTTALDSIAVIGHSGATGIQSDPAVPSRDAHENSWATGENPDVDSIYAHLLRDHPAMKGHNYNAAANGTAVDDLLPQFESLLATASPLPDVVLVQSIDNDMRCDGTDAQNLGPYATALDAALTQMEKRIPHVQFFFVSQWATVASWTAWARRHPQAVASASEPGPCQAFVHGKPHTKGIRSMQAIVDAYWHQVITVCAKHPDCFTDGGIEQSFVPTDADVAADETHLTIAGQHKFADLAWQAFPQEIAHRK